VPVDLVTTDFSGFDPDISEAGALTQVNHVAAARNLDPARVRALVEKDVQGRVIGVFGEPHVNVLLLNMALDAGEAA
jgi:K+-transporting ATPase ATPase C chain